MKVCPHCAEQVQDAAVVCQRCGREIASARAKASLGSRDVGWGGAAVVILVGAIAAGVVHSRQVQIARQVTDDSLAAATRGQVQRRADSIDAVTPRLLPLLDKTIMVDARGYYVTTFIVPSGTHCTVIGHARGIASDDEFAALVLTDDGIVAWQANPGGASPLWQSNETTTTVFDVPLPSAGKYGLIVSNKAESVLKHHVDVAAQARCTRDWPPR